MAQMETGSSDRTRFNPGFRCSLFDVAVLVVGGMATVLGAQFGWWMGVLIGFVVSQFFLFCNVFRVSRRLELAWAALFVGLMSCSQLTDLIDWTVAFVIATAATLLIVAVEMRRPSYHGIGWQRINPHLEAWWESRAATRRMSES